MFSLAEVSTTLDTCLVLILLSPIFESPFLCFQKGSLWVVLAVLEHSVDQDGLHSHRSFGLCLPGAAGINGVGHRTIFFTFK